ncbi:MAG: ABC transporter substrate-binding protein [Candidatus Dormibacteraeota bacterium]|nr:ABC transporter substrate-binding protein [Candidatus Dormibacteraeota bacterium]
MRFAIRSVGPWAAGLTAAMLLVAACGGSASSGSSGTTTFKGTKKVGLSIALTGQSALYGDSISKGAQLAIDDINKAGGVNSYKLALDTLDDATTVDKAVANVKQLILQDNASVLLGQVTSAQCQATSPISKANKILYMAATCNSYQLTSEPDLVNPYYVSVVPNTYMEGTAAGNVAAKVRAKKIFIVSPKYLFGISETNAFVATLKKADPEAQIVNPQSTWYVPFPTNPDWHSTINAIQSYKPDLVYSNIFAADEINFIKQATQVDPIFFKTYPMTTLVSLDEFKALGASYPADMHAYMRAPFFALSNPKLDSFVSAYKSRYGVYPSDWAIMDYDAVQVWAKAANAAKSFDPDAVLKHIDGQSFQSLRGYTMTIRPEDQQANVGETIGTTVASGGKYPFVTLQGSTNLQGSKIIMPVQMVKELRAGQCENGGDPKTANFALCPSFKSS